MTVKTVSVEIAEEERRQAQEERRLKALAGLQSGELRVEKAGDRHWRVHNTKTRSTYNVYASDGWSCDCPDYTQRGMHSGVLCKHIHAVRAVIKEKVKNTLQQPTQPASVSQTAPQAAPAQVTKSTQPAARANAARNGQQAQPAQPAKASQPAANAAPKPAAANGQPAQAKPVATQAKAQPAQAKPTPAKATEARDGAQAATDPESVVVHWGRHKGRTLGELAKQAPQFLAWMAFRMEVRSDEDRRLQQAARAVYDRVKAARKASGGKGGGKGGKGAADPLSAFLAQAAVELLKKIWSAQERGYHLEDRAVQKAIQIRLQAIRLVAEELRALQL